MVEKVAPEGVRCVCDAWATPTGRLNGSRVRGREGAFTRAVGVEG